MAEAVHPKRIVLFGSYAYGKPTPDSDVDFLLICDEKSKEKRQQTYLAASKALDPRPFPVDIIVRHSDEVEERIKHGDYFLQDIMEKGHILYER